MIGTLGEKACVCAVAISVLVALVSMAATAQSTAVPSEDARNTTIVTTDTHLPLPAFSSPKAGKTGRHFSGTRSWWRRGCHHFRKRALCMRRVFGRIEERDYTIEKVLIETLPGFYLGGNLYRPKDGRAKHPAVL